MSKCDSTCVVVFQGEPLPAALVELVRNTPISSIDDLQLLLLTDSVGKDLQVLIHFKDIWRGSQLKYFRHMRSLIKLRETWWHLVIRIQVVRSESTYQIKNVAFILQNEHSCRDILLK